VRFLGCTYALVAIASSGACQASANDAPTVTGPAPIVAHDSLGGVIATVAQAHPCDVQVLGAHVTVHAVPLLATIGSDQWAGDVTDTGLVLRKGTDLVARVKDTGATLAVFDPTGAAWIRVDATGAIHGAGGQLLRTVTADRTMLRVGDTTVTGTSDTQLAALLTASEVPADVRALAVCNHLLQHEGTP
jgi:hypothetical protein